jgi:hypothetical protein
MPRTMPPGVLALAALLVLALGQADPNLAAAPASRGAPGGLAEAILAAAGGDRQAEGLLHPLGTQDAARVFQVGEVVDRLNALDLPSAAEEDGGPADAVGLGVQAGPVPLPHVGEPRCFPVFYYTLRGAIPPLFTVRQRADVDLLVEDRCPNLGAVPVHTWDEVTVVDPGSERVLAMCASAAAWSDGGPAGVQRCGWRTMTFRGNAAAFSFDLFGLGIDVVLGEAGMVTVAT